MQTKEQVLQMIQDSGMVAVVRGETKEKARAIVESCIEGGIKAIELTFTVPFAHRVIEDLAIQYGDKILLGAGTVLDPETARIAILSGAKFVVAPHHKTLQSVSNCKHGGDSNRPGSSRSNGSRRRYFKTVSG